MPRTDFSGKQFGQLTIIGLAPSPRGTRYWVATCGCGATTRVRTSHLTSGNTVSCGCRRSRYEDITGKTFGRLLVLSHLRLVKTKHYWKCQCTCGNEVEVDGASLRSGNTSSCGCLQRERTAAVSLRHGLRRRGQYNPEYERMRRQDPRYKLQRNAACLARGGLRRKGGSKRGISFFAKVPYTVDELRLHLESLWLPGMTWANYGTYWHIDHKKPQAAFEFTSMDDPGFQACWSLSNLQPLVAAENLKKGRKH